MNRWEWAVMILLAALVIWMAILASLCHAASVELRDNEGELVWAYEGDECISVTVGKRTTVTCPNGITSSITIESLEPEELTPPAREWWHDKYDMHLELL